MKYVLLWIAMSGTGSIATGSEQFEDKAACEAAGADFVVDGDGFTTESRAGPITVTFLCKPSRSDPKL